MSAIVPRPQSARVPGGRLARVLGLVALTGCTGAAQVEPADVPNVMLIGSEGNLDHSALDSADPAEKERIGDATLFSRIAQGFAAFERGDRILITLNGGLNSPADVLARMRKHKAAIEDGKYYPLFIGWPTQLGDSYKVRAAYVRDGSRVPAFRYSAPFYVLGDVTEGYGRAPLTYGSTTLDYLKTYLLRDQPRFQRVFTMCADGDKLAPAGGRIDADRNLVFSASRSRVSDASSDTASGPPCQLTDADVPGDERLGKALYAAATIPRLVLTPLADSIGQSAWEELVRRTRLTIRRETELNGYAWNLENLGSGRADAVRETMARFPLGTGSVAQFFQRFAACVGASPARVRQDVCPFAEGSRERTKLRRARITLVAHSMGAIVANEVLAQMPDLPWENIVYMAAASSVRDTARAVSPVLERASGRTRFFNLMLHPLNDAREQTLAGFGPAGSLLTYIDEMYENPKTPLDRTMGRWNNLREARHVFPSTARQWMLFRVFDRAGINEAGKLTRHGDFNDDGVAYWSPEFWGACGLTWADGAPMC